MGCDTYAREGTGDIKGEGGAEPFPWYARVNTSSNGGPSKEGPTAVNAGGGIDRSSSSSSGIS